MKWKIITMCIFIISIFRTFPFINPKYINDMYDKIKSECHEYNYIHFLEIFRLL